MKLRSEITSSLLVGLVNFFAAALAFLSFLFPRFSDWGLRILPFTFPILLLTGILVVCDLCRAGRRWKAIFGLLFSLPVLMLYGILTVWEGPLYFGAKGSTPLKFEVRGPAGFHSLKIYDSNDPHPELNQGDKGLVWGIEWTSPSRFPPMDLEFSFGELPSGFRQTGYKTDGSSPALNPNDTYTLVINPAMGMSEHFSLHGNQISEYKPASGVIVGR